MCAQPYHKICKCVSIRSLRKAFHARNYWPALVVREPSVSMPSSPRHRAPLRERECRYCDVDVPSCRCGVNNRALSLSPARALLLPYLLGFLLTESHSAFRFTSCRRRDPSPRSSISTPRVISLINMEPSILNTIVHH